MDGGDHRHAGAEPGGELLPRVDADAHRDALRHLHEIARSGVGLDDAELAARRGGDAFDMAGQLRAAERVDAKARRLSDADLRGLRFLEIGNDPVRSEEHTSELQSLMRNSYAVF